MSIYKGSDENYFNPSGIIIRPVSKDVANSMVIKHHYSHAKTMNKYSFGVYHIEDNKFLEGPGSEKLIGVIIYGHPVGRQTIKSISPLLNNGEVLELTRLFIHDGYGKNIESYSISQSLKWIKKNDDKVKVIISYSDPEQNHVGTIYQALNFGYNGTKIRLFNAYWYKFPGIDKWMHQRSAVQKFGSVYNKNLLKIFPDGYEIKECMRKHRYVLFICNKDEKKKYMDTLKHEFLPYPKKKDYLDHIEKIIKITS